MMTTLEKLEAKQSRVDQKCKQIDKLRREIIRDEMAAIFEALGIKTVPALNDISHSSQKVMIRAENNISYGLSNGEPATIKKPYFSVRASVNGVELSLNVTDHTVKELQTFRELIGLRSHA